MHAQMTNEELAMRIKAGEKQYIDELYQRTRKILSHYAKLHSERIKKYPDLSIDDLLQCGYFAFTKAIRSFDPYGIHEFHAYISFKYRHEINRLLGLHRENGGYAYRPVMFSLNEKEIDVIMSERGK